jgi:patatin-like phospholipase/acyl hydrolase
MKHMPVILSLDGGGVRGLSSLLILRDIMEEIERRPGMSSPAKPCDYFDLIGGTSTGGLIAIMLGLLGMVYRFLSPASN